jgi:Tfp pilus assembly protein PilP
MKTKFCLLKTAFCAMVFLFAVSLLCPGMQSQDRKEKKQVIKEQKSLVLKQLLVRSKKTLDPPKRNIFTRQRTRSSAEYNSPSGDFQSPEPTLEQIQSPDQENTPMESESLRMNVQYIGYVQSGNKVVALIILEGQTYAVESGDILETGVTIGKITPDDLEIIDSGSEPLRINLEGEEP